MPAPRPYLVKCCVWGGDHIKTFNTIEEAQFHTESFRMKNQKGIPHIYKLVR